MRLLAFVLAVGVGAQALAGQDPPPQFKTGIEVRQVDVVVVDRDGRPVRGLTAADFTVLEDGRPQRVSTLEEIVVPEPAPPSASWMREVAPDVGTNNIPTDGRLIVIVMDDATVRDLALVESSRKIGREIVRQMGPADLAAVVYTLQNSKSQDLTSDHARLLAAIERHGPGPVQTDPAVMDPRLGEANFREASIRTLEQASEYLRAIERRRKVVIYVSVGVPIDWTDISSPITNLGQMEVRVGGREAMRDVGDAFERMLEEAQLSNVAVYAVSPRGVSVEDTWLETDFLRTVSANTGGFPIVNSNTPETRVREIFTATSAYYLIGYEVQKQDDGRFRRLEVTVDRPGVTVHARKGYVAPRPNRRAEAKPAPGIPPLATAMAGFLPKGDVPMQATAIPLPLPGKSEAGVAIVARVRQEPVQKRTTQQVELLTTAFDPNGKARESRRQTATVTMLPSDSSVAEYEVLSRIDLKPGRYNLRIAAHNAAIEKSGSVFFDLDVPNFKKDGLWMSGVALTSRYGLSAAPPGALADLLPVVPTTVRAFAADDEVGAFLQIVQGGRRPATPVRLELSIVDADDAVVHQAQDTLEAAMFSAARFANYQVQVPVDRLSPGSYLLRIDATAGERTARREIRFTRKTS
jgi:VWFA-related protein